MRCTCASVWQVESLALNSGAASSLCTAAPHFLGGQREGKPLGPPSSERHYTIASHFYLSNYFFNNSLAIFNIDDDDGGVGGCVLCASDTSAAESALSVLCVYVFFVCVCARDAFYAMLSLLLCFQCEECRLCILAFD